MPIHKMPDVIVLLPGITGSILKKDGKVVWGFSAGTIAKALFTFGAGMEKALALPHDDPVAEDLGDGIVADELMPDLHLLPGVWKIDGYSKIIKAIEANFNVTRGVNFFPFAYDWRRDNRSSARKLAKAARNWLFQWRRSSGNSQAKLILVAHSMGGLVSRYFLECLEGWTLTKALVTYGTPYRGSLNALDGLANGLKKGPLELSWFARQLTALYQLLPIFECYDPGNGKLLRVGETTGIPNVDPEKAAAALAFHREIEAAVDANGTIPEYHSAGYHTFPIVGSAQQTFLSARCADDRVEMLYTYKGTELYGDGTVARVSAIPIELSDNPIGAVYVGTKHGSLQNADATITHLAGVISSLDLDLGPFKIARPQQTVVRISLDIEDVFLHQEPVTAHARAENPDMDLMATLFRRGEIYPLAVKEMQSGSNDWRHVAFPPQRPGVYRVAIAGVGAETAEDAFVITDQQVRT